MRRRRGLWIALAVLFLLVIAAGGYLYSQEVLLPGDEPVEMTLLTGEAQIGDIMISVDGSATLAPSTVELGFATGGYVAEVLVSVGDIVEAGDEITTFNADGTFVEVQTTDESGVPFNWRSEGTWSTRGSSLNLISEQEGPDAENLQPIDPPEWQCATWSVSANTLAIAVAAPFPPFVTVTGSLQRR